MDYIIKSNVKYEYIIKLHAKKSKHCNYGESWRKELTDALIGTNQKVKNNIKKFEKDTTLGMICSNKYLITEHNISWMEDILIELKLPLQHILFSAGTMFMIRFNILHNFLSNINTIELSERMTLGYSTTHKLEHKMERVLGLIVSVSGYNIIGV